MQSSHIWVCQTSKFTDFKISHLFQVLVHPLCEGLLLYGIPFIWGKGDQLKEEEEEEEEKDREEEDGRKMKAKETLD